MKKKEYFCKKVCSNLGDITGIQSIYYKSCRSLIYLRRKKCLKELMLWIQYYIALSCQLLLLCGNAHSK